MTVSPGGLSSLVAHLLKAMMSWAFARFGSMQATIIVATKVVIILAPVSFFLFKFGIWVDFVVPLIGIELHQVVAEYEEKNS